jgi:hypothetical protein
MGSGSMNEARALTIDVSLTEQDYLDMNTSAYNTRASFTLLSVITVLLVIMEVIGFVVGGWREFDGSTAFTVFLIILSVMLPIALRRSVRKAYKNKFLQEDKQYIVTEEGLTMHSPSTNMVTSWKDVVSVKQTKVSMLLFIATNAAHIIPHRAFASQEDAAYFRQLISRHVQPAKSNKPRRAWLILLYVALFIISFAVMHFLSTNGS